MTIHHASLKFNQFEALQWDGKNWEEFQANIPELTDLYVDDFGQGPLLRIDLPGEDHFITLHSGDWFVWKHGKNHFIHHVFQEEVFNSLFSHCEYEPPEDGAHGL